MYTASDILKMLKTLDDELKSEIKDAEPKTHDSQYNMGFAVGLYSARMGIRQIFKAVNEENRRVERMVDAIIDGIGEDIENPIDNDKSDRSGCKKCPVVVCDAVYRSSRCAALRFDAGADYDPESC